MVYVPGVLYACMLRPGMLRRHFLPTHCVLVFRSMVVRHPRIMFAVARWRFIDIPAVQRLIHLLVVHRLMLTAALPGMGVAVIGRLGVAGRLFRHIRLAVFVRRVLMVTSCSTAILVMSVMLMFLFTHVCSLPPGISLHRSG
jgi:hypothetical protein